MGEFNKKSKPQNNTHTDSLIFKKLKMVAPATSKLGSVIVDQALLEHTAKTVSLLRNTSKRGSRSQI